MTFSLKHAFFSPKSDGGDTTLVRPSNWNAEHTMTMATGKILGRATGTDGAVEEVSMGNGLILDPTTKTIDVNGVGMVAFFAMNTAPTGWLKANGAAVSRTTYAALFAKIGTTFGVGDGSTTFNIPDMRAYFPRGWDDGRGVDSGRAFGTAQADANLSHNHGVNDPTHAHSISDPGHGHGVGDPGHSHYNASDGNNFVTAGGTLGSGSGLGYKQTAGTAAAGTGIWIGGSGTGIGIYGAGTGISIQASGAVEARPKNIALLACIRY